MRLDDVKVEDGAFRQRITELRAIQVSFLVMVDRLREFRAYIPQNVLKDNVDESELDAESTDDPNPVVPGSRNSDSSGNSSRHSSLNSLDNNSRRNSFQNSSKENHFSPPSGVTNSLMRAIMMHTQVCVQCFNMRGTHTIPFDRLREVHAEGMAIVSAITTTHYDGQPSEKLPALPVSQTPLEVSAEWLPQNKTKK